MPLWPFSRKRRAAAKDSGPQLLSEKLPPTDPPRAVTSASQPVTRKTSRTGSRRRPRAATQQEKPSESLRGGGDTGAFVTAKPPAEFELDKENIRPRTRHSSDDDEAITALPMSRRLEHSPHLRPVDVERAAVPYSFRPYSGSQTSIQQQEELQLRSRPNTLRSKRSGYDHASVPRRQSTKKRRDDPVREEEIRAMSHPVAIPKRPGGFSDSPLRRESKKVRAIGQKDSTISLPAQEPSVHSSVLSGIMEQRGWEIGGLDMFNPRPVVRLSGVPQYVAVSTAPETSYMTRELSRREEKMPARQPTSRKRQTIGDRVDDLDTSDLRVILERDAKRREQKKKSQQEKLDKKLRGRSGRNRGDSDRSRHRREAEEALQRTGIRTSRDIVTPRTPPTAIHPAFRGQSMEETVAAAGTVAGLGIVEAQAPFYPSAEQDISSATPSENPFEDAREELEETSSSEEMAVIPGDFSAVATPMESTIHTAREVQIPTSSTARATPSRVEPLPVEPPPSDPRQAEPLLTPPPLSLDPKRASEPPQDASRRAGGWTGFFRRSTLRRPNEGIVPPSERSFSNTSRESMRNQPLPAHLVDARASGIERRRSETPGRTQSRFREDLPELPAPLSPPDSRIPSPDITTAAGLAAVARRANLASQSVDVPRRAATTRAAGTESPGPGRNDTPVSPSVRGHGLMSASLASIGSEGSWLASGSVKRQSVQSGMSRSLSKRQQQGTTASYEDLGGDRDTEYFQRMTPSPDQALHAGLVQQQASISALAGTQAEEGEESDDDGIVGPRPISEGDPLTVHESVRRQPTLVHRDPRVQSREGLLDEFGNGGADSFAEESPEVAGHDSTSTPPDEDGDTEPEPDLEVLQRATSISYHDRGHVRQISAGSARLLDVAAARRRLSGDSTPMTPTSPMYPPRVD